MAARVDLWRQDRSLDAAAIGRAGLIGLDVFDTLMFRKSGPPDSIFETTARLAAQRGLFREPATEAWWPRIRQTAEAIARDRQRGLAGTAEIGFDAIYAALPDGLGDRAALQALEWASELDAVQANPFLVSLLHDLRAQVPVVLLSDMYLGAGRIRELLRRAGIDETLYRALLVSCDHGVSKSDGGLFKLALGQFPGLAMLHIGDNPHGDVAMPLSLGIAALPYRAAPRLRAMLDHEETLGAAQPAVSGTRREIAAHFRPDGEPDDGFWFDQGLMSFGPIADAFGRFVLADCLERGITRIAPFLREGDLFASVLRRHAAGIPGMEIRPLGVSRQALYLPTLETFGAAELQRLASSSVFRTLGDLVEAHGVGTLPPRLEPFRGHYVVDLVGRPDGDLPDVFAAVVAFMLAPDTVAQVMAAAAEQRERLLRYLDAELGPPGQIATVDFGARASTQSLLSRIPEVAERWPTEHYLFYGLAMLARAIAGGLKVTLFMPLNTANFDKAQTIHRSPQFLELCLNGNLPTTASYGSDARPVPGPLIGALEQRQRLASVQAGIARYLDLAADLAPFDPAEPVAEADRAALFDMIYRMVHLPTAEEARRFGDLLYDYGDHHAAVRRIIDPPARAAVRAETVGQPYRVKSLGLARAASVPWPQGTITLDEPDHISALYEGAGASVGHRLFCRLLIKRIKDAGADTVIVAAAGGDGGMGPSFIRLAREAGLALAGYLDYFPERVAGVFHGVPVLSPAALAGQSCQTYAVISTGYGAELRRGIAGVLGETGARFFDLGTEARA